MLKQEKTQLDAGSGYRAHRVSARLGAFMSERETFKPSWPRRTRQHATMSPGRAPPRLCGNDGVLSS